MSRRKKTINSELFTAQVSSLSHDGRGISHLNGKTIFISGALPNETVQFQIIKKRGSFDEANAVNILAAAPQRSQPSCPHFGVCGGCSLQHVNPDLQLQYKENTLRELLTRQAKVVPQQWLPPITSPAWGYRRKARLGVKFINKKNRLVIGFRERQGHLIADSQQCAVLVPAVGNHLQDLAEMLATLSIKDKIPQLEVATGDNDCALVVRHLAPFSAEDLEKIINLANRLQLRIYLQPGGIDSLHLLYPPSCAPLYYRLPRYDLKLEFQPLQFIQINAAVNEAMIDLALQLLDCQPHESVLDLFCGIGNFSLPLAKQSMQVTGVEGDISAVKQAQHNAVSNGLTNASFYCEDLFQSAFTGEWAKKNYDKMLLDPPRSGAESIVAAIHQWRPKKIVYVSCDLATLARDAQNLCRQGYLLEKAGIMDMFPHTQHAEAIALFRNDYE